jgi:hypothetical protein
VSVLVLATSIIRSQKSRSLLAFITLLINKRICNTCMSVLSEHLLFSELVWNISGFSKSFLVASCSFHFGVTVEFSAWLEASWEKCFTMNYWQGTGNSFLPRPG